MYVFMFFGLIWLLLWISDKTGFIAMVSASSYYFSSSADGEGSASVMKGVWWTYTKHGGSLAFGSFIHAVIVILQMMVNAAKKAAE